VLRGCLPQLGHHCVGRRQELLAAVIRREVGEGILRAVRSIDRRVERAGAVSPPGRVVVRRRSVGVGGEVAFMGGVEELVDVGGQGAEVEVLQVLQHFEDAPAVVGILLRPVSSIGRGVLNIYACQEVLFGLPQVQMHQNLWQWLPCLKAQAHAPEILEPQRCL
jgi:hypothetical protein